VGTPERGANCGAFALVDLVVQNADQALVVLLISPRDLKGPVGGAVIHDHYFARYTVLKRCFEYPVEQRSYEPLLVIKRDENGNEIFVKHPANDIFS
jgi:hypothetical protein